jgi:hypothetical protein
MRPRPRFRTGRGLAHRNPEQSSTRCCAWNEACTASTWPAPRPERFARQVSGQPPLTVTQTALAELSPLERTSAHSTSSSAGAATGKISNLRICSSPLSIGGTGPRPSLA